MKKIVALALCLALALALCTVAFAATTYQWAYVNSDAGAQTFTVQASPLSLTENAAVAPANEAGTGNVTYYTAGNDSYVKTTTPKQGDIAVFTSDATSFKTANVLFYLHPVTAGFNNLEYAEVFTGLTKDKNACGSYYYFNFDAAKTYYCTYSDTVGTLDKIYVADADGATYLWVEGKAVPATVVVNTPVKTAHSFDTIVTKDADGNVATVKCSQCGDVWTFTKDYATASAAGKNNYMAYGAGYIYDTTPAAAATTTTGVSSAKTFDAGVALYAGMALMSVAGSAVVIGKKKEF